MKDAFSLVSKITDYFATRRGVGHSDLARLGWSNFPSDCVLVVQNRDQFSHVRGARVVSLEEFPEAMISSSAPIIFDNHALHTLLREMLIEHLNLLRESKRER